MNTSLTKFLRPELYLAHLTLAANTTLLSLAERLFAPPPRETLRHPPVFFLGAPRSGSTLMVQAITDAFNIGYMSNRHAQFFGAPFVAERLLHPLGNKPRSDFRSWHGVTEGHHAPAESGNWWYRFFPRNPPYVELADVDTSKMLLFRRSLAALTNAIDRPVVFKNLYASFRIQAIAHYLPESLFIVTRRNEIDNGHSLLEVRQRVFGDYGTWWSMPPPNVTDLQKLPPAHQVIEQIREIHRIIERDLAFAAVPPTRVFELCYDEFCADVPGSIDALERFFLANNCTLARTNTALPRKFDVRREVRIDASLFSELKAYATKSRHS